MTDLHVSASMRVWAPNAGRVEVEAMGARYAMAPAGGGWWEARPDGAEHGTDYAFRLDGGEARPDPRSRWQPYGVHGFSRLLDHGRFGWTDAGWHGRPLRGAVIYELHIGTFTAQGTFDAAIDRLDHLADLGVSHVELMPVGSFPGERGWGYDGVALYAVHEPYGGPDGLKRFVDAAHARGLAVLLDVVYNHLGPAGNYLHEFGPYFTDRYTTPWGDALNLDGPGSDEVRRFLIDNALSWIDEYHVDGLRLDAIHAIFDQSAVHFLEELGVAVHGRGAELGRPLLLVAESDLNDPRVVRPREQGGYGLDAQWSDDLHHALHAALTEERDGYYVDYGSLGDVATALSHGFVIAGQYSQHRGRRHGRPPAGVPGSRFLGYLQNHDQIGNRARGERIGQLVPGELVKIGAGLVLTSPFTPMLFMGEEWNAGTPWQYFTDHDDPRLARAVREGRREEFEQIGQERQVPDPQSQATFERSRLDWSELERAAHAELLRWYRSLIRLRQTHAEIVEDDLGAVVTRWSEDDRWLTVRRGSLMITVNLADRRQAVPLEGTANQILLASVPGAELGAGELTLPARALAIVIS